MGDTIVIAYRTRSSTGGRVFVPIELLNDAVVRTGDLPAFSAVFVEYGGQLL
ncbi:MAG: hypothetical protein ACLUZ4_03600 [Christensenellaceae bacterium]